MAGALQETFGLRVLERLSEHREFRSSFRVSIRVASDWFGTALFLVREYRPASGAASFRNVRCVEEVGVV